jgi:hypothetical protein
VSDIGPESVELRAAHLVIAQQHLFDLLHLWPGLGQPGADSLFLDAFDAMDGGKRVSVGQHRETFNDRFFAMMLAVKDSPASFGDDFLAGRALPALTAFACKSELPQIARADSTVIHALFIPAKGIWSG